MNNEHRIYQLLCILIIVTLLPACSHSATPQAPVTQAMPLSSIQLEPCTLGGTTALCGTLSVYENRASRIGRMIDLSVAVVKARSSQPASDPIFWLAGGPGAAAIKDIPYALKVLGQANEQRDLVFVDQRGVGSSNNLVCDQPVDPATQVKALGDCLKTLNGDPSAYTTAWAMDDVDDVREALGYDQINLYGESYGATAAQVYLLRHEKNVRTVSLAGVSLLSVAMFEQWPLTSQVALDRLFARCNAEADCHSSYPDLEQEFAGAIAQLERGPIALPVNDPSIGQPVMLTLELFNKGVHNLLVGTESATMLPQLIHMVYKEDLNGLAAFITPLLSAMPQNAQWKIINLEILCYEDWAKTRPAETAALTSGSYLRYEDVRALTVPEEICAVMPPPQPEALYGPSTHSSVAVLLVNGELDPQDPPENVAEAQQIYPNSLTLVAPGQAHGYTGSACRSVIMADFIDRGSVQGVDAGCLNSVLLPGFVLP